MSLLLDTGVWLRAVAEPETIPRRILTVLNLRTTIFYLSAISIWEIGKKVQIGKLQLSKDLRIWFRDALAENISVLPITPDIVVDAARLPDFPTRDPADELIVATARVHTLRLLTTDRKLKRYSHANIEYFKPIGETD
jgi:PIN domain nuclease of toxin-antitoxin system